MVTTLPPPTLPSSIGGSSTTLQQQPTACSCTCTAQSDTPCLGYTIGLGIGLGVMSIVCVVLIVVIYIMKRRHPDEDHDYEAVEEQPVKQSPLSPQGSAKSAKPMTSVTEHAPKIPTRPPKKKSIQNSRQAKQGSSKSNDDSLRSDDAKLDGEANMAFAQNENSGENVISSEIKDSHIETDKTELMDTEVSKEYIQEDHKPVETRPEIRHASKPQEEQTCHTPTNELPKSNDIPVNSIKQHTSAEAFQNSRVDESVTQDVAKKEIESSSETYEAKIKNIDENSIKQMSTEDGKDCGAATASGDTISLGAISNEGSGIINDWDIGEAPNLRGLGSFSDSDECIYCAVKKRLNSLRTK